MFAARTITVLALALVMQAYAVVEARDHMPWVPDLATAQQLAATQNRLLLLHFSSDDCAPCRQLEKKIFSKHTFGHAISELFVPVNINVSKQPELARQFNVNAWPTDLVLDAGGQEIHRMVSPQDSTKYLSTLRQVAWRHRSTAPGAMLARYPVNTPSSTMPMNRPPLGTAPTNQRTTATQTSLYEASTPQAHFARGQVFQQNNPVQPAQQSGFSGDASSNVAAANPVSHMSSQGARPPAIRPQAVTIKNQSVVTQNAVATPEVSNDETSIYGAPMQGSDGSNALTPPAQEQSLYTAQPLSAPAAGRSTTPANTMSDRVSPATSPMVNTAPQTDGLNQGSVAGNAAAPPANAGSVMTVSANAPFNAQQTIDPKMGLEGFCPITLVEDDQWIRGDAKWGARHRGRVYLFQNAAAQQRFLTAPDRYSPVLSGYDPVLFVETGQLVEGYRAHGLRFQDSVLLFNSEDTLSRFSQNPQELLTRLQASVQTANSSNTLR